jgi:hypothetical protein
MTEKVIAFPDVPDLKEGENWMEDGLDEEEREEIPENFSLEEEEAEAGEEGHTEKGPEPDPAIQIEPENTVELDSVLERLHGAMIDLMEMQSTRAYKELVRELKAQIEHSKTLLLNIDKPKEVIRQQEYVRCIAFVMETIKKPVDEYMEFLRQHPLFASTEDLLAARWEEDTWTAVFV